MIGEQAQVDGHQAAEAAARAEKRGIWRGAFEQPHEWRRRNARSD